MTMDVQIRVSLVIVEMVSLMMEKYVTMVLQTLGELLVIHTVK